MSAQAINKMMTPAYFELVEKFPLAPIRDDHHLDAAQEMIDKLLEEELEYGKQEYLDALTVMVEAYENEHYPIPDASEADVLRELMSANRLSQKELEKKAGISQSTISAVVNGERRLTRDQMVTLAKFFNVSPMVFLPA